MMSVRTKTQSVLQFGLNVVLLCSWASCTASPAATTPAEPQISSPMRVAGSGVGNSAGVGSPAPVSGPAAGSSPLPAATAGTGITVAGRGTGPVLPLAGMGGAGGKTAAGSSQPLPCALSQLVAAKCMQCHGTTPIGGAPMSLLTYDDFHQAAKTMPTLKVYELVKMRIHDQAKPMPPGGGLSAADLSALDTWLGAGALAGSASEGGCATMPPPTTGGDGQEFGALTPMPGETCYDFPVHQSTTSVDATPYTVVGGEHYEQFYFKAPWPKGSVATRYGTKLDNAKVLHHWLLFKTSETDPEGSHKTSPLPTLLGVNATLMAGWAVGGNNLKMPDDVGLEMPDAGTELNVQWHFYNSTGSTETDHSAVQVCVVPAAMRPHIAAMTWLGSEDLGGAIWSGGPGMPAHQMSNFSGTCKPLRTGMNATDPIHVLAFWPHMHKLGVNMKTVVNHKAGMSETIFDKPFDFNHQVHYAQQFDLMPGDTMTATCTFNNTTDHGVPFGESSDSEMCYQFVYSWPAHALENHAMSWLGATNTCW